MLEWKRGASAGAAIAVGALVLIALTEIAAAKRPGGRHCALGVCHRVMTLAETGTQIGRLHHLKASYYDDCRHDRFNPCGLTSSGEIFRPHMPDNVASAIHPDGTILVLRNPATGLSVVARVNNFGPFRGDRKLDVSKAAAKRLGFASRGVATLEVMVVYAPTPAESRYAKKRRYDPVPGFIGATASMDSAYLKSADLTLPHRIAKSDATACRVAAKRSAPRLTPVASGGTLIRLARN
ncbi:MAG: septal ring lytic transglycosylase RlpA family protein [Hyphomicrobiaceae bacterium]